MELIEKTQRYFKFDVKNSIKMKYRGISFDGKTAWFPRDHAEHIEKGNLIFTNENECKNYMELVMNSRKQMEPVEKINSVSSELKAVNLAEDPAEWKQIQKQMIEPEAFSPEDVKAFSMLLCNNFIDRDDERFALQTVKDFKTSIVGKLRLHDHNTSIKTGKFYEAEIIETTVDEAKKLIGYNARKDITKQLEKIRDIDGGIFWLKVKFYVMNRTELEKQRVSDIQAGIDYYTSIRFNCPLCEPYYEEGGSKVMFWEWKPDNNKRAEALEGSGVWLGAQYGTVNQKGAGGKYFSEKLLQNLPPSYIKHWTELNLVHDPSLKYFCREIDSLIEKGILTVGNIDNRKIYFERSEEDLDMEFSEVIENPDRTINLPALRVKLDKIDKIAGERNYSEVNKYLGRLGLIEPDANVQLNKGVERMKIKLNSLDDNVEYELIEDNEESVKKLDEAIQSKIDIALEAMSEQVGEGEKAPVMTDEDKGHIEFAKAVIKAFPGVTAETIEAAINDQKRYRDSIVENILKLERLMKVYENDEKVEAAKAMYEKDAINDLLQKFDYVKNLFNSTQKGYQFDGFMLKQSPSPIDEPKPEDEKPKAEKAFRAIEL